MTPIAEPYWRRIRLRRRRQRAGLAAKPLVIGFSQVGAESEWRTANTARSRTRPKAGHHPEIRRRPAAQENQVKAIRSFIAQRVDVIAFSPVVESGWDTVLREAKAAKIPVILTDRAVKVSDPRCTSPSSVPISSKKAAAPAAGWWNAPRRTPDTVLNIVELQGTVGSAPALDRKKGFEEVIAGQSEAEDHPLADRRLHPHQGQGSDGSLPQGRGQEHQRAVRAQRRHGHRRDPGDRGSRPEAGQGHPRVSIDGVKGAFEAMIAGKLNVTVECNPLLGPQLMQIARDVVAGKPVPSASRRHEGVFPAEVAAKEFPNRKY
jgi:ABC-type sugar transport system substrate-binding protein